MKDTEVIEILPDGTVYHFDMDVCNDVADQVLDQLIEKEDNPLGYDYTATVYSLFAKAVYVLVDAGWTPQELLQTVLTHSDAALSDGFEEIDDDEE